MASSNGYTETEKFLSDLCKRTFLKLWAYTNPHKSDKKEFCDVVAIFENHMFIFFDRNNKLENLSNLTDEEIVIKWKRWLKNVIKKQINTANGAERYIKNGGILYSDINLSSEIPIKYDLQNLVIHKIVIAHGAKDACLAYSKDNINGSLAIKYYDSEYSQHVESVFPNITFPFQITLNKNNIVHVFDSHNLEILLGELDTFRDFTDYIVEKEYSIKNSLSFVYCGEEDLLALYFENYDEKEKRHFIYDEKYNMTLIVEGGWNGFIQKDAYKRKKEANKQSYLWDSLLDEFIGFALTGELKGNANVFDYNNGIYEMAKESRFVRRVFSKGIIDAMDNFPIIPLPIYRTLRTIQSDSTSTIYLFLQYFYDKNEYDENYATEMRRYSLEIACAAAIEKYPNYEKVIGIGMFAPKFYPNTTKDIILFLRDKLSDEDKEYYIQENKKEMNRFYENPTTTRLRDHEFPKE